MTVAVSGENITFPDNSVQATAPKVGMVNRIINGAMVISQRNAGASVTANDGVYSLDRFKCAATVNGKFSMQQNAGAVTLPNGFTNYLGCTSTAATSVGAGDFYQIRQVIEGYNAADLGWGTANAQPATLSFLVYSSLTGTFGGSLNNSAFDRSFPFSFSVPTANTWTTVSVTIAGETTGTWLKTNGTGIQVCWSLGSGSTYSGTAGAWASTTYTSATGAVSVVGTSGATFYITGVQLEKGSTATSFDYRPYGTELGLCQRYYINLISGSTSIAMGFMWNTSELAAVVNVPVTMRTSPSLVQTTGTAYYAFERAAGSQTFSSFSNIVRWGFQSGYLYTSSSGTTGNVGELRGNNAASYIALSSEL